MREPGKGDLLFHKYFVSEDIDRWNGTEEDILKAQRRVLEVGGCFLAE